MLKFFLAPSQFDPMKHYIEILYPFSLGHSLNTLTLAHQKLSSLPGQAGEPPLSS